MLLLFIYKYVYLKFGVCNGQKVKRRFYKRLQKKEVLLRIRFVNLPTNCYTFSISFFGAYACNNQSDVKGFIVMRGEKEVLTYTYGTGLNVNRGYELNVTTDGNVITVFFGDDYNKLTVDDDKMSVKVTDASCKTGDCISSGELTNNGVIMCLPNSIKILPLNNDGGLIVGGLDEKFS